MICRLCPRECGAQRTEQRGSGFCGMPAGIRVARAALHRWEEPPISGTNGSGAVFFSGCTLRCCYCQNHAISAEGFGKDVTPQRLRAIFEELIAQGAHNIDLITATHFLPWILPALEPKLPVPLVYNCGGYEKVETLRRVVIRHLVLPGYPDNSRRVMDWVARTFRPGDVLFSLMSQYTPQPDAQGRLARRVTRAEYRAAAEYMRNCGIVDGFTQERTAAKEEYTPPFDLTGV